MDKLKQVSSTRRWHWGANTPHHILPNTGKNMHQGGETMWEIKQGDAIEVLKTMPEQSVHCCVTSPPYFGLRDYGVEGIAKRFNKRRSAVCIGGVGKICKTTINFALNAME